MLAAGADLIVRTWAGTPCGCSRPGAAPSTLVAALDAAGEAPAEHAVRVDERRPDGVTLALAPAHRPPAGRGGRAGAPPVAQGRRQARPHPRPALARGGGLRAARDQPAGRGLPARAGARALPLRWQVELGLQAAEVPDGPGRLPAKSADLARAWLHAKLILALSPRTRPRPGRPFPLRPARAASLWRVTRAVLLSLTSAILGSLPLHRWRQHAATLWRHLAEPPRRRRSQADEATRCLS